MSTMTLARSELILGGQKSGKSRRGELLAQQWLAQSPDHRAVMVATARPWDEEMRERIRRHQKDRAERVPGMVTVEEPVQLAQVLIQHSAPDTLVVVDCLTLWLTNLLMPAPGLEISDAEVARERASLVDAIAPAPGPLVLIGNEIGLGVIPLGRETRAFVDALGKLNQDVAVACRRVTLMAAGLSLTLKDFS
ncbi:adenosyl cobinamide kinase/adenosyl cobinamide phosphate guanylyltransferase [Polaromonas sp. CF318]|uniref:bifunctional adenosylcobinamide kinase/adenosylcobinamide-phosphate guanylyltransferase n=1 Tax=Polaromonas sp. CF318 TaxID=1144318 RepID=UPI000270E35C|nr:bifunctional adenosylcobinamide kinase/adenosylcobinamide-phosphate guanylyltransferase [Polaromonas sp. CF318]EJL80790.1 adenosyl cobinamide kinase/adenosyl cobinamide phosphate guanylyltransferase [Polaromonas sp. CF318]